MQRKREVISDECAMGVWSAERVAGDAAWHDVLMQLKSLDRQTDT